MLENCPKNLINGNYRAKNIRVIFQTGCYVNLKYCNFVYTYVISYVANATQFEIRLLILWKFYIQIVVLKSRKVVGLFANMSNSYGKVLLNYKTLFIRQYKSQFVVQKSRKSKKLWNTNEKKKQKVLHGREILFCKFKRRERFKFYYNYTKWHKLGWITAIIGNF